MQALLGRYELRGAAIKVVGVGDVHRMVFFYG
jgi:hypothetical protein